MKKEEFEVRLSALIKEVASARQNFGCVQCVGCEGCHNSTFCRESQRLVRCQYCVRSQDLTECTHCIGCKACLNCVHCIDSERCAQSSYVIRSIGLVGCTYCFGCVGLQRKDFHILNEPYDRKTYFALTQKLTKELGIQQSER